jgi:hypothetical protein
MNKSILRTFVILFGLSVLVSACGGDSDSGKTDASKEFSDAAKDLDSTIPDVIYELPSPSEIPGLLERTGVDFNGELLNSEEKVDSYLSGSDKAALNLGIYSTDVGYLIAYEKVQDALNYMSTSRKLAEELGLTGSFEAAIVQRFEQNLGNKDSLTVLLDNTIGNSSEYLRRDDRTRTAALLLTGGLVEGLHISCQLVKNFSPDLPEEYRNAVLTDLIRVILEQDKAVSEVKKMLGAIDQKAPVDKIAGLIDQLNTSYAALDVDELIKNNQGGLVLTDQNIVEITKIVEELRASIIN